jgi:hypothetical protein
MVSCDGEERRLCEEEECHESCVAGGHVTGVCDGEECRCLGDADGDADGDSDGDPCDGVDCTGLGHCLSDGARAICICDEGYHAEGLSCLPVGADGDADADGEPGPCDGVTCSGHGRCFDDGATALCVCDEGYHASGLACLPDGGDGDADGDSDVSQPGVIAPTSGGGTSRTGSYRLRISVGAPQPMSTGRASGYRLSLGPGRRP